MRPWHIGGLVRTSYELDLGDVGAFLPARVPVDDLPPVLARFGLACAQLPGRYPRDRGGVRSWLDGEFRRDHLEVRRAISRLDHAQAESLLTILCVLGHTYRWNTVPPAPERFAERLIALPPGIEGPWRRLARASGQPRVGSAWTLHLTNWRMTGRPGGSEYRPEELTSSTVHIAHGWLGPPIDAQLDSFSVAFVLMEALGADVLRAIVETVECAVGRAVDATLAALQRLHSAIATITLGFSKNVRKRTVDPTTWLELIQPTFSWAAYVDDPTRIEGGPSGMQLGTVQALDAVLGIRSCTPLAQMAGSARRSMPSPHQRFLATLDVAGPILRAFVAETGCRELTDQYDTCVAALSSFRVTHRARGALYLRNRPNDDAPRASTGLAIGAHDDPVVTFEQSMNERIAETQAAMFRSRQSREAPDPHVLTP